MAHDQEATEQSHLDAGDGVERTVTQARSGVRRGVSKILVISTVLAVLAIGAVWILAARPARQSIAIQTIAPATAQQANTLRSQAWDQSRLGAQGMAKCSAFRQVLKHTGELRSAEPGAMSRSQRTELDAELKTAKDMQPAALTPFQCGVPLG